MATPTITTIAPAIGHTGGHTLVEIQGTGFQLPPATTAGQDTTPEAAPTVRVTFGGVPALDVVVESDTVLFAVTPVSPASTTLPTGRVDFGPGRVDVVVENIDDDGVTIAGETVTAANGYEYVRPDLAEQGVFSAVLSRFIEELRRQVMPNVVFAVHSEWSENGVTINFAHIPTLPAIILLSADFVASENVASQGPDEESLPNGRFLQTRSSDICDVVLELVLAAKELAVVTTLLQVVRRLLRYKFSKLLVPKDPRECTDATGIDVPTTQWVGGYTEHPVLLLDDGHRVVPTAGSDVKTVTMRVAIRDVVVDDIPGLPWDGTTETPANIPGDRVVRVGTVMDNIVVTSHRK